MPNNSVVRIGGMMYFLKIITISYLTFILTVVNSLASPGDKNELTTIVGTVENIYLEKIYEGTRNVGFTLRLVLKEDEKKFHINPNDAVPWGLVSKPVNGKFEVISKGKKVKLECIFRWISTHMEGKVTIDSRKTKFDSLKTNTEGYYAVKSAKIIGQFQYEDELNKLRRNQGESNEIKSNTLKGDDILTMKKKSKKKISKGMTREAVLGAWGKPSRVGVITGKDKWDRIIVWDYKPELVVFDDNNKVEKIATSEGELFKKVETWIPEKDAVLTEEEQVDKMKKRR
jgi:hypothetical protein